MTVGEDSVTDSDDDFVPEVPQAVSMWDTGPLDHIRRAAHARDVPDVALLAATLAVLSAEIHPRVVLPDVGKGHGNLNMFVALVARSGGGKTSTIRAAQEIVGRDESKTINPSSGEGMLDAYREWSTSKKPRMDPKTGKTTVEPERQYLWKHRSCFMMVDEVGTMEGVTQRRGSTLISNLNTAWSGSSLMTTTADPNRNRDIPAGEYRLAGIVGVQDNATEMLLGEQATRGTAQRFIFVKATFPTDHEYTDDVVFPGRLHIDLKPECWVNRERDSEESEEIDIVIDGVPIKEKEKQIVLAAPRSVKIETKRRTRESQRDGSEDPLDGHRAYTQLKIAGLLGLLHGRMGITEDDWARASALMGLSEQEVGRLREIGQREKAKAVIVAGRMDTKRSFAAEEERVRHWSLHISKVVRKHDLEDKHGEGEGCGVRCLKDSMGKRGREYLKRALEAALGREWMEETVVSAYSDQGHTGIRYLPGKKRPGR